MHVMQSWGLYVYCLPAYCLDRLRWNCGTMHIALYQRHFVPCLLPSLPPQLSPLSWMIKQGERSHIQILGKHLKAKNEEKTAIMKEIIEGINMNLWRWWTLHTNSIWKRGSTETEAYQRHLCFNPIVFLRLLATKHPSTWRIARILWWVFHKIVKLLVLTQNFHKIFPKSVHLHKDFGNKFELRYIQQGSFSKSPFILGSRAYNHPISRQLNFE